MPLVQGWLLDCYPSKDDKGGMTFWVKTPDGQAVKLKDSRWRAKIYAAGEACDNVSYLLSRVRSSGLIHSIKHVNKRADFFRTNRNRLLEIELADAGRIRKLAELLENTFQNPDALQLYNVDILPEQQYFYEKDLFPLAFVEADAEENGEIRRWTLLDKITDYDYETPDLKTLRLHVGISNLVPRLDSKLCSIELSSIDSDNQEKEIALIKGKSESDILLEAMKEIEKFDPDLIITQSGDSFVLPFLYSKASKFSIDLSKLNRDDAVESNSAPNQKTGGKTYFSYGRILYRPTTHRLFGRLHLDEQNTFIYDQCMLQGLFEVSRLCRIPIHTSMRASIGKCLSSLQCYYASKEDILIPWKPETIEDTKNGYELFLADRGGLVLKPLPGVHEHVGEIDFASLYPSIIRNYNISAETVNCSCCSNSKFQIEELGMHICGKREGIIARSLVLPLDKRFEYKRLRDTTSDQRLKRIYNERAGSLKWILVCCLAKESPVLIKRNESIEHTKIGSFIDDLIGEREGIIDCPHDILVAGVGRDLKSKFCKISKLIKIPKLNRKLLSVALDGGNRIIATQDHPFYVLEKERFQVRPASELKAGALIPVEKRDSNLPLTTWTTIETAADVGNPSTKSIALLQRNMAGSDLEFVRARKIEELADRKDEYVYCFQLANDEIPGFFTGAVFTHNCFGYLSYRNAKFGKIDSHIAVCSVARKTFVEAMHTAEYNGFRVVHGIVDSLWLSKRNATRSDYEDLKTNIEKDTGFKLSIEGIYKWIVFLPSKTYSKKQVANRYFGAFERTNDLKVRGIELRRHDAPLYFKKCQEKILKELAKCNNEKELRECARWKCVEIFERYAQDLDDHKVPPTELIITRRLSKNPNEYSSERQLSVNAAAHLSRQGLELKAGQSVSYVITHYESAGKNRSIPEELVAANAEYDSQRYVELLADCCATVLYPLGVTKEELLTRSQSLLSW